MIELRRLNSEIVYVNPDLIRMVEEKPDITLTFTSGEKLVVQNSPKEIITKIIEFRKSYQRDIKE